MNRWAGSIAFGPNRLLYNGPIGPTGAAAHHADQIIVSALAEPLELEAGSQPLCGAVIRIPSDVRHSIRQGAGLADVLFIESTRNALDRDDCLWRIGAPRAITDWRTAVDRAASIQQIVVPVHQVESSAVAHPAVDTTLALLPDLAVDGARSRPSSSRHAPSSHGRSG